MSPSSLIHGLHVTYILFLRASDNCGTLAISRVQKRWGYLSPTVRKDLLAAAVPSISKTKSVRHTKAMRPTSSEAMSSKERRRSKKAIPVVWVDGGVAFLMVEAFFPFSTKKSATTTTTLHIANAAWFDCCLSRQQEGYVTTSPWPGPFLKKASDWELWREGLNLTLYLLVHIIYLQVITKVRKCNESGLCALF